MAKRLTEKQKEEIIKLFTSGISIEKISERFNFTKLTISRNLKKNLGENIYQKIFLRSKADNKLTSHSESKLTKNTLHNVWNDNKEKFNEKIEKELLIGSKFVEIAPLNIDIDNSPQKDFTSISISEVIFPKTVFMIVDKKVELEIKYLKDYPKWQFLSNEELNRKSIEIYGELKIAKGFCGKEQKVIKIPNTKIFKIVAPILLSRGISRIVSSNKLIAL